MMVSFGGGVAVVEVGAVGCPATGKGDVGQVAAGSVSEHGMGGVGGDALGGVHGDRVPELHLLAQVIAVEDGPRASLMRRAAMRGCSRLSSTLTTRQRCPLRTGASARIWVRLSAW